MNRLLLITMATAALSAQAQISKEECPDCAFSHISPNGRYVVAQYDGSMQVYDRQTNQRYNFVSDWETGEFFTAGLGNAVSDTGIVVASTTSENNARYWENGEWHDLDITGSSGAVNFANAVTPDGQRICGCIAAHEMTTDGDFLMGLPVYWDRLPDGTYSECHVLPYPELDFSHRVPQYVTAVSISDDGKTIVGQVRDCSGFVHQPIVYTQEDDGSWTYKLLLAEYFERPDITWPEYPGYGPQGPSKQDYMSPEKYAEYQEDVQLYWETGQGEEPQEDSYLTPEQLEAYNAALAKYEQDFAEWQEKNDAFYAVWNEVVASLPPMLFNNVFVTPDGNKFIGTKINAEDDPMGWMPVEKMEPWVIDIASDKVVAQYAGGDYTISQVPNNDIVLAWDGRSTGYILANGEITPLHDYLAGLSPEMKTWVDETLTREVEVENPDTYELEIKNLIYTGMPLASADMNVMAFSSACDWDYMNHIAWGYIIDRSAENSINYVTSDPSTLVVSDASGHVALTPAVAYATLYNTAGAAVTSLSADQSATLPSGLYLIKAHMADGSIATAKLAL